MSFEGGILAARTGLGWMAALPRWWRLASEFDVVHAHTGDCWPLLWTMRRARLAKPILLTLHSNNAVRREALHAVNRGGFSLRLHHMLDGRSIALADAVAPTSVHAAFEFFGPAWPERCVVILQGLPTPPSAASPERERPEVDLLYAGGSGAGKGASLLPDILDHVRASHPEVRLRVAGIPPASRRAVRLGRELATRGLEGRVEILGSLGDEALRAQFRRAKVMIAPSVYEGLPYAVLEAMAEGLPVVATDIPGHREIVEHGRNGLLAAADAAALATGCSQLLADDSRRRDMGRAAVETVRERFSLEREVEAYLALYEKLAMRS